MEDVVRIGLPLGECVGLQHRQSWLRFPPNTDEEVHSCWADASGFPNRFCISLDCSIPGELSFAANSGELARTPREFAIGSPTPTLRRTPANVRRSTLNVRRNSAEFARVRPSSPGLCCELADGSPENSFAGRNYIHF